MSYKKPKDHNRRDIHILQNITTQGNYDTTPRYSTRGCAAITDTWACFYKHDRDVVLGNSQTTLLEGASPLFAIVLNAPHWPLDSRLRGNDGCLWAIGVQHAYTWALAIIALAPGSFVEDSSG